jgi:hypothetical protein
MEKDFHYFTIYSIAKITGFADADIIAYSSQFVDDNNEGQFSIDGSKSFFPEKIPSDGGHYYPIMTQSLSPKSLNPYVQKYVYVPFHFLPGDNTVIIDGKKNTLNTTPNSYNAKIIVKQALDSDNPYQIGIALHTYADTWSHQNFTGMQEGWNAVYPWYDIFKSIVPNIGHAEVGHSPDIISETWTDNRTKEKVVNRIRALDAVGQIYRALRKKTGQGPNWGSIKPEFKKLMDANDYDDRKTKINALLHKNGLGEVPKYDKNSWIGDALDKSGNEVVMQPGFEDTHWHKFHLAAKTHFATVIELIKDL